jgi:hypothetical protein
MAEISGLRNLIHPMPRLRRVVRSIRWLGWMLKIWWSPNRIFLTTFPGHFYSPLPDLAELESDHNRILEYARACLPGIDLDATGQIELANRLLRYVDEFPFALAPTQGHRYYLANSYFTGGDAYGIYAMLREFRPSRIIEIGSGFSSAAMLDVNGLFLDGRTRFTFIDPEPQRLLSLLGQADSATVEVISKRIQDVPIELFSQLQENDILFVDSSHVSKVGSDVGHIAFEILPMLKPGVLIHFHDIFWPFEYPKGWVTAGRAWNEAYLLRAFFQYNKSFKIVLFLSYLENHYPALARRLAPPGTVLNQVSEYNGGSSLWLRKIC